MAIKKRLVECECGEMYLENSRNQLEGNVVCGAWKLKESRKRTTRTDVGSDILLATFERPVGCGKCKQELLRERRQYELTPPVNQSDEPVSVYSSREYVLRPSGTPAQAQDSMVHVRNGKPVTGEHPIYQPDEAAIT